MLGNFSKKLSSAVVVFSTLIFFKYSLGLPSGCQTVWIQIRPDNVSGLIWVQTAFKGYQQTTQVHILHPAGYIYAAGVSRFSSLLNSHQTHDVLIGNILMLINKLNIIFHCINVIIFFPYISLKLEMYPHNTDDPTSSTITNSAMSMQKDSCFQNEIYPCSEW